MASAFSSLFTKKSVSNLTLAAPLLREAYEQREKKQREILMTVAVDVIDAVERQKEQYVQQLRTIRAQEKNVKAALKKLQTASAYYEETLNFGPLYHMLGAGLCTTWCTRLGVCGPTPEDMKVPDGWTPKTELSEVNDE